MELENKDDLNQGKYVEIPDRTGTSILLIIFLGVLPGIIALIYNNKASDLYCQAMASKDNYARESLYQKAKQKDKVSKTWIIIGFTLPFALFIIGIIVVFVSEAMGINI